MRAYAFKLIKLIKLIQLIQLILPLSICEYTVFESLACRP